MLPLCCTDFFIWERKQHKKKSSLQFPYGNPQNPKILYFLLAEKKKTISVNGNLSRGEKRMCLKTNFEGKRSKPGFLKFLAQFDH